MLLIHLCGLATRAYEIFDGSVTSPSTNCLASEKVISFSNFILKIVQFSIKSNFIHVAPWGCISKLFLMLKSMYVEVCKRHFMSMGQRRHDLSRNWYFLFKGCDNLPHEWAVSNQHTGECISLHHTPYYPASIVTLAHQLCSAPSQLTAEVAPTLAFVDCVALVDSGR